jgi:bifunctional UDP-N-acetylglucosamine pyrophosphorylase/glucosamine-1-phosphate N-acetyltransferase
MNIVILAAGLGKRMHSKLPKVLQPLAGRPMLDWVLESASPLAPQGTVVVVGHGAELIRERYADRPGVRFALQSEQLGTGHALRCALPQIDPADPATLVCLGDVPLLKRATLERMREKAADGALVLLTVNLENPAGYGRIIRSAEGAVIAIVEEKDADAAQKAVHEVNTGIMVLPTARLEKWLGELGNANAQGEYYLTDLIGFAARDGVRIETAQPDHAWEVEGVNSKAQLAALERTYQRTVAEGLMERGVTLIDPARIDVRGELTCGNDVEIDVGCVFEGRVVIGNGVKVGPYCVIRDTEIKDGAEILAFSHFDGAVVGPECRVGPYSRLRPGAELAGGNHIGNFVEVKKSTVGLGSKVNHLSYIGDATVGARVNIGAGTITCNYDGVNKFRTVIGDDAFIGSDTQLIAPVEVGAGATLGAGTTLARNAPAGKLTLSRARQVTVEGWKRPVKKQ